MNHGKVLCRCVEGRCFLEKDTEWARQNHARASHPNGICLDYALLSVLDAERLHEKGRWMDSLGVNGTGQICCRCRTEKSP